MFKKLSLTILIIISVIAQVHAARPDTVRTAVADFCNSRPKIDGFINDACWQHTQSNSSFRQRGPVFGAPATFRTDVKISYDNQALYIAAIMLDKAPDSILKQLGNRDDGGLNADWFAISLDTYNNQLDAYFFRVYASGVQTERRFQDWTYSTVWQSATRITKNGWVAEIRIPWSAIRFPETPDQLWGLQLERSIRRNRELDQWALEPKGEANQQVYWGNLTGVCNIKAPPRLSLTPYLSTAVEHYPYNETGKSNYSYAFSGGANLKYGINQSFTLDVSLLPDFSQVKSDNQVKNISAFETIYGENRPFFRENMDLFKRGGLFYSRRIGQKPPGYSAVDDDLDTMAVIKDNPAQAKLINAVKFYGRTNDGLAVGVLNAITRRSEAIIHYPDGHEEKIETGPLSNYNIAVLDQALKNNSSVYFINTNKWTEGNYDKANVSATGLSLYDRSNNYRLRLNGSYALNFDRDEDKNKFVNTEGYQYAAFIGKVSGNIQYDAYRRVYSDNYDINDMGITQRNNEDYNRLTLKYKIFEPFWKLRSFNSFIQFSNQNHHQTHKNINSIARLGLSATNLNYLSWWYRVYVSPFERYDYYEARTEGRYYIKPPYWGTYFGFSTDYRNPMALDGSMRFNFDERDYQQAFFSIKPQFRISDKLFLNYKVDFNFISNERGYVDTDSTNNIIFGKREIKGVENVINSRYMFRNNLSLGLWMRYYWYTGEYDKYYKLCDDGYLSDHGFSEPDNDYNFSFNAFNIDLKFNWEFAPGSNFSLVWKNSVLRDEPKESDNFMENVSRTMDAPKLNNISLKILYYLDYQEIFRRNQKNGSNSEG